VLEHTRARRAARNIEALLQPGGLAYIADALVAGLPRHADDYWRFSLRGLMLMFEGWRSVSSFYSGGDVGWMSPIASSATAARARPRAGAVEQGLFQLVLDHEDNRAVLARQATERLPVSRTYLPTLFVNIVGRGRELQ
jgi:hypothetical protein